MPRGFPQKPSKKHVVGHALKNTFCFWGVETKPNPKTGIREDEYKYLKVEVTDPEGGLGRKGREGRSSEATTKLRLTLHKTAGATEMPLPASRRRLDENSLAFKGCVNPDKRSRYHEGLT